MNRQVLGFFLFFGMILLGLVTSHWVPCDWSSYLHGFIFGSFSTIPCKMWLDGKGE